MRAVMKEPHPYAAHCQRTCCHCGTGTAAAALSHSVTEPEDPGPGPGPGGPPAAARGRLQKLRPAPFVSSDVACACKHVLLVHRTPSPSRDPVCTPGAFKLVYGHYQYRDRERTRRQDGDFLTLAAWQWPCLFPIKLLPLVALV
jgi:hypothetical protein